MKLYSLGLVAILIAIAALAIGSAAHVKLGAGNPVTKAEDAVIEAETGLPVDIDALTEDVEEIVKEIEGK